MYFARKQLERHEEACCDAWAIHHLAISPRVYGESLLCVVDFIAENHAGLPRLASGMQPTDSLAERLRLMMHSQTRLEISKKLRLSVYVVGMAVFLVHPTVHWVSAASSSNTFAELETIVHRDTPVVDVPEIRSTTDRSMTSVPAVPLGFWNQGPQTEWANHTLSLGQARLVADAAQGISIELSGRPPLRFDSQEITAMVDLKSSHRLIISDAQGHVRLWDLNAQVPVSLIGRHAVRVTSLAYLESIGIIWGDIAGTIVRWDVQSGRRLANWSGTDSPIQSLRLSRDGKTLAVLIGSWERSSSRHEVHMLDSATLKPRDIVFVPSDTALVVNHAERDWVRVTWGGTVFDLQHQSLIQRVPKVSVSGLVLSQDIAIPDGEVSNRSIQSSDLPE